MKPIVLASYDDERTKLSIQVPVKGRKPATVKIPRFDYIDEDTFDALMSDLEELDVEQQIIGVANDLKDVEVGEQVTWELLLDDARKQLTDLGVKVEKSMKQGQMRDLVSAPTQAVLDALAPFSSQQPLPLRKRSRSIALTMLKHVVSEQEWEWFNDLPTGALDELLTEWRSASTLSLGEFAASPQN